MVFWTISDYKRKKSSKPIEIYEANLNWKSQISLISIEKKTASMATLGRVSADSRLRSPVLV